MQSLRLTVTFFQFLQDYYSIVFCLLLFSRSLFQMVFAGERAWVQMFLRFSLWLWYFAVEGQCNSVQIYFYFFYSGFMSSV